LLRGSGVHGDASKVALWAIERVTLIITAPSLVPARPDAVRIPRVASPA
jgi:hypothetical protein